MSSKERYELQLQLEAKERINELTGCQMLKNEIQYLQIASSKINLQELEAIDDQAFKLMIKNIDSCIDALDQIKDKFLSNRQEIESRHHRQIFANRYEKKHYMQDENGL